VCGFLLLLVGLVFGQTLGHDFVGFDDAAFVSENPQVTAGLTLPGLWWALTDGPFGEWCPLSTLSDMLDCQLYGVKPAGHYLTNVLLHAASTVLLFLVLLRMTGDLWPGAWVAAVFAIHPLHVESVAWVAERRDVLSGLFFMLTLGAYALYAERPSLTRYLTVAGMFALGLMAKPMLVTLPFLLLLLDYWPLGRFRSAVASDSRVGRLPVGWRLVLEKIPLMALTAVACVIVLSTHASTRSTRSLDHLSLVTRLANALVSYATYVAQSFYPAGLAPFYPHPGTQLPVASVAEALVLLVAITALAACCWRRRPYVLVGWLWFLGTLVPVIGLVQLGGHIRADRYTYLSQIGLSIALAWGVWGLNQSWQSGRAATWRGWTLAAVSAATVLALATLAWRQTSYWRNAETLWTHTLGCTEHNALAHYSLGYTYSLQGKTEEVITHLREAVAADSINRKLVSDCHVLLGECLAKQGKNDESLAEYEHAVRILPTGSQYHARLAIALAAAGQFDRAIAEWRQTVRLVPTDSRAYLGLADALLDAGDADEAIAVCRVVLSHEPESVTAIVILGAALADQGKVAQAIPYLEHALKLEPRNASAHFRLGLALYDIGQSSSAIDQLNAAIQIWPDNVLMLWQTAWILATSPDSSIRNGARGVELAKKAIQLSGGHEARPFDALAAALADIEKFSTAVEAAEQASAVAQDRNDNALVDAIAKRTSLYRQGLPYRQPASALSGETTPPKARE
jgi:tetratricopeptide (TPR) repeat protein